MKKVKVYNMGGEKVGEEKLNPDIFDVEIKKGVIHRVIEARLSNIRNTVASTKNRGEVRGGGRKPWRQKGTGRARAGSIRSPIWRGGGVTFGPTLEKNFKKKINRSEKRKALFMALTSKVRNKKVIFVNKFEMDNIKTKKVVEILDKLPISGRNVLITLPKKDNVISKSVNNLAEAEVILANSLNAYDVLKFDSLLLPKDSIRVIEKTYLK